MSTPAKPPMPEPGSKPSSDQHTPRPVARRLIRLAVSLLTVTVVLIGVTFFYLAGTTSGLRLLITYSQPWLPGSLDVQQVNGSILNRPNLRGITYRQPGTKLSVSRLSLNWQPGALIAGRLHIISLDIEQPVLTQTEPKESTPDNPSGSLALADISLPLQLQIDALNIRQLSLINHTTKANSEPAPATHISTILISLHTDADTLFVDQLKVVTPQHSLQLSGQLKPNAQFPVELDTQWSVTLPEQQPLSGQGTIKGTLKGSNNALKVQQNIRGLFNTELSASLQNLLEKPQGQLNLNAIKADLGQLTPELTDSTMTGSASAAGNPDQIRLNSQLQVHLPEIGDTQLSLQLHFAQNTLRIEQLDLTQTEQPQSNTHEAIRIRLTGDVNIASTPLSFNIKGHWNNLRYPLTGDAAYVSPKGQLQISGDLQHYQFTATSLVAGPSIPPGQWTLSGNGNDHQADSLLLTGNTLEGSVEVSGKIAWQPQLNWNFKTTGKQLNPGSFWPEWPGKLNFQAAVKGSQSPAQPLKLQLLLESLSGVLREEPLSSHGNITVSGSRITIPELRLNVAATEIHTSGTIDEQFNLSWTAHSPDLNQLLPGLNGSIKGTGSLTGTRATPHLIARIEGQDLAFDAYQTTRLSADLNVDLTPDAGSHIQLTASQLNIAGNQWEKLTINGQGTTDLHQLTLITEKGPADLELTLSGQWKDTQWRGILTKLNLIQQELGRWQIQRPVPVQLSTSAAQLNSLCLGSTVNEISSVCLTANWSSMEGIQGAISTQQLSLTHLQPWIPTQAQLKGYLESDVTFSQSPGLPPVVKGHATVKGTELFLEEDDLRIIAGDITLRLQGQDNQFRAVINLPLQQPAGKLSAQITIDDPYRSKQLSGDFDLAVNDLKFISLFTPELQAITGQASSKISFSGTLDKPLADGQLTLTNASTDLPALGIRLEQINLSVTGKPGSNALQIEGGLQSGNGPVQLNGQYNPVTDTGEISLEGHRFQAVATEDIQAWISPSVKLSISPQRIMLRGEITIPEASIKPPDIEATFPVSEDVVIIDPNNQNPPEAISKRTLETQMRITLGDKVSLEALGFEGRLLGSVLVEDDGHQVTRATGTMQVASGQYRLYGQDLNIDRGSLVYSGGPIDNPGLDLRISRQIDDVTAGAKVSGTLNNPRLSLFSEPAMPESSQLSYLMFGHAPGAGGSSITEQELLFKAASALTLKGGNTIAEQISETFNIDELGVAGGDTATDTSLYIGKYLSPRLYVKYGVGLLEPTHTFFMRYRLNSAWSVETQTATEHNGGDIIYTMER
ncbi:translocation/assembly module TamB domain-containing protein [uncultured Amphritea sp.]|uniref:translocation/assembly module TamB domain-containing protein n=1 Tax=uncultured Amphritea sp. TaxID=981605 RepID=UPI0025ECEC43|nr:translocation/assembly module TamB domain-containing protein [uncultured Amphritea sp.]